MYVSQFAFDAFFVPTLNVIYNTEKEPSNLICTDNYCYFNVTDCKDVVKQGTTLMLNLGK